MAVRNQLVCNFQHFLVSFNSFYGNKDQKTCGEFQISREKIIYVQVERILISIRRELDGLQFSRSRDTTEPNTEYIFSQLAVNIIWYCRLKIAISI